MREKKKGKSGNASNYTTRAQALRKLQISLADFRRLCILKGIYPREPRKKFDGTNKTYYLTKDIKFLLHEPLLVKIRELRAYRRKVKRARAKKDEGQLKLLLRNKPTYKLDHLIRERYPTFADAMRDLDDALTLVHLFQRLPSERAIKSHRVRNCERLAKEFQNFVAISGSLDKVFVSIKGIYFSAKIGGERAIWVEPHRFTQELPNDVDFRVMLTFLEFYECLLAFVNYRLYTERGLSYPPTLGQQVESSALEPLKPLKQTEKPAAKEVDDHHIKEVQANVSKIIRANEQNDAESDDDEDAAAEANPMAEGEDETSDGANMEQTRLFSGLKVFVGRETPMPTLEFILRAHGAQVGWDGEGSPFSSDLAGLTHWVMDRPAIPGKQRLNVEYVQPQWVFDCVNNRNLLPVSLYGVGVPLPPHLSPFVDDEAEGYTPKYRTYIERLRAGDPDLYKETAIAVGLDSEDEEDGAIDEDDGEEAEKDSDEEMEDDDDDDQGEDKEETGESNVEEGEDSEDSEEEDEEETELEKPKSDKEAKDLAKLMMSKKKRNLYERMINGKRRRSEEVERLERRQEELEKKSKKKKTTRPVKG